MADGKTPAHGDVSSRRMRGLTTRRTAGGGGARRTAAAAVMWPAHVRQAVHG